MMEDTWSPVMMTDTEDAAAEWRSDAQLDQTQERKGGECFAKNCVAGLRRSLAIYVFEMWIDKLWHLFC